MSSQGGVRVDQTGLVHVPRPTAEDLGVVSNWRHEQVVQLVAKPALSLCPAKGATATDPAARCPIRVKTTRAASAPNRAEHQRRIVESCQAARAAATSRRGA